MHLVGIYPIRYSIINKKATRMDGSYAMVYWLGCHKYTKICELNVQLDQILCDG
jgi:hypothetical protein